MLESYPNPRFSSQTLHDKEYMDRKRINRNFGDAHSGYICEQCGIRMYCSEYLYCDLTEREALRFLQSYEDALRPFCTSLRICSRNHQKQCKAHQGDVLFPSGRTPEMVCVLSGVQDTRNYCEHTGDT